jgi:hypothetical protein
MWGGPYGVAADTRDDCVCDVVDIVDGAVRDTKKYACLYACEIIIIRV